MPRRVLLAVALAAMVVTPGCTSLTDLLGTGVRTDWAYDVTELDALTDEALTGRGVRVAVVDTGLDTGHPDLEGIRLAGWRDFVAGRGAPYDDNGHGTHVSGLIVGQAQKSDLRGGAPEVGLLVAKAIGSDGSGTDQNVAQAIRWSVQNDADVISLSLGGGRLPVLGSATEDAARDAVSQGVFVVAAAGNDGEDDDGQVATPANVPRVIAVGAMDSSGNVASFSSRGSQTKENIGGIGVGDRSDPHLKPEAVAPGVRITSTVPTGDCQLCTDSGYGAVSGTSQAVPFASSAVALVLQDRPAWQQEGSQGGDGQAIDEIKRALMESADPVAGQDTPHDDRAGYGLLKARGWRDRV